MYLKKGTTEIGKMDGITIFHTYQNVQENSMVLNLFELPVCESIHVQGQSGNMISLLALQNKETNSKGSATNSIDKCNLQIIYGNSKDQN